LAAQLASLCILPAIDSIQTIMSQVAIITGGASGMGLEVAKVLAAKGNWILHLFDMNESAGEAAAASLSNATFHKVNVIDYASISSAFEKVFVSAGRLDFVFANAGIVERHSFYERPEPNGTKPPPEPNVLSLTINLNGVILTTWLAVHYFRLSPHKGKGASIVMTASCGGLVSTLSSKFAS
jgi:NAD(P)-dependent dehydrogenase (short-subunit alcohol dehydrogenase family)